MPISNSIDLQDFWFEHGKKWAQEEASPDDIGQISAIAKSIKNLSDKKAAPKVITALKAIWTNGFTGDDAPYGWNEMGDELPDTSMLAFVRGVSAA